MVPVYDYDLECQDGLLVQVRLLTTGNAEQTSTNAMKYSVCETGRLLVLAVR